MPTESVMPFSYLILCRPLFLLPLIPPSIRVFSNELTLRIRWPKYWSFSFSISPSNEHPGLISFRMDRLDLLAVQGTLKSLLQHHSSKASICILTNRSNRDSLVSLWWNNYLAVNKQSPSCQLGITPRKELGKISRYRFRVWPLKCELQEIMVKREISIFMKVGQNFSVSSSEYAYALPCVWGDKIPTLTVRTSCHNRGWRI